MEKKVVLTPIQEGLLLHQETKERFGYAVKSLSVGSHKKVLHKCVVCGQEKETRYCKFIKESGLSHMWCRDIKRKQTNLEKYGVETPLQSPEIREKMKQTCLERCGVDNPRKSSDIIKKIRNTNLEKYGVEHPAQSEVIKSKMRETCLERYGADNVFSLDKVKEQIKQTNLQKFGVEHPAQAEAVSDKIRLPFDFVKREIEKELGYILLSTTYERCDMPLIIQCSAKHIYQGTWSGFKRGYRCPECNESKNEKKLGEILVEIFSDKVQRQDNLQFLKRQAVDFSVRSLKLAFEYDGEQHFRPVCFGGMSLEKATKQFEKQKKRDARKDKLCRQNGYRLVRIAYNEDLTLENVEAKIDEALNEQCE